MMKRFLPFLALICGLLWSQIAEASHFRYGTITWVVPDPQNAPLTVRFTVQTAWRFDFVNPVTNLQFGDGQQNGNTGGTIIGTGVDTAGLQYTVREYTVNHTYAAAGTFTAFFADSARIAGLQNGANGPYRVETVVSLAAGNTGGPVSASPAIIQMQVGAIRTYTFPIFDADSDPTSCRYATPAESGLPAGQTIPTVPNGGAQPTLSAGPAGCTVTWDVTNAVAGQQYVLHLVLESTHGGVISSTALDLIVEMITGPVPACAGTGFFIADVGSLFMTDTIGTQAAMSPMTVTTINAPLTSTLTPPSGSVGMSPFSNTFTWTPIATDAGTTTIVIVNYTNNQNASGTCFLTIQVPQCPNFGEPCESGGIGECNVAGTNVCAGPGITVCGAVMGMPQEELCDNLDNNCDGTPDDGNPESGQACPTGLPGACATGLTNCAMGGMLDCIPDVTPGQLMETCNDVDDDCDGLTDEDFNLGAPCMEGLGECVSTGDLVCAVDGTTDCNATPGMPGVEICGDGLDSDCDGANDNGCPDTDGDGLIDVIEDQIGTDPNDADSDDDGVPDGNEPSPDVDTDGDGLINALDPDSDDDGLYDGTELGLDCSNPATNTALGHCRADADPSTTTDPLDDDTDDGGATDGSEDSNLDGAVDAGETDPTTGNGADDSDNPDTDGDGLSDDLEGTLGSNPNDADTDNDGVLDGDEANPADDTDGDGLINVLDVDSDDDGLFDGTEVGNDCDNPATDATLGHCIPDGDGGATTTSPLDPDSDNGGASDGTEDSNLNGVVDAGETDPTSGNGADDAMNPDTDGDGLGDDLEETIGTDPNDVDSDNDGVLDGDEPNPSDDHDGDGTPNSIDEDSDGDGLFDGTEVGNDCDNPDTDPVAMNCTPDGDGGTTTTNPLDSDTDDGGVSDGDEDTNHNGVVDPGERDPLNGADDIVMVCTMDSDCGDTMSGMVCNDMGMCIGGCRGTNGNGCPTGEECTSTDDSIGMCIDPGCTTDSDCGGAMSGMVCNDTGVCIDGCRGENGNGCIAGQECTSTTATIGTCVVPTGCMTDADCGDNAKFCDIAASGGVCRDRTIYAEGNGILCSASPGNDNQAPWGTWVVALVAGAALYRRRRR